MKYYIKNMIQNLSKEDTLFLKEIYEPKVVAIPPVDACCNMCVTTEGEIRIYGSKDKEGWGDFGTGVYISSKDCGLSWKLHKYNDGKTLGAAGYNPQSGRYISVYPTPYRRDMKKSIKGNGSYIIINDEGYNSENNRFIKISDKTFEFLKQPEYLESCNRWIALSQYENNTKTVPVVCVSDDDGESWHINIFERCAPEYPQGEEDKGIRWQNHSCEPDFVELSDGTLLMIVRTSQNYHYMYKSSDHGTTWSEEPTPTIFNGTNTMPVLYKLDNGKILFFWCNSEMLPEIDQQKTIPPLNEYELSGASEDVFTNRDANHLAISEDDGKTWVGFREVFLNPASSVLGAEWTAYHPRTDVKGGFNRKTSYEYNLNDLKRHLEYAHKYNVGIAVENMPLFPYTKPEWRFFGGGWEELCELCDELNSDKIGICWDFGHANTANLSQEKALGEIGNRLKITHVHDNSKNGDHHQLPLLGGDEWGCINWTETMSAVKSINYKGPLTLELIYPPKQMLEGFIKHSLRKFLRRKKHL